MRGPEKEKTSSTSLHSAKSYFSLVEQAETTTAKLTQFTSQVHPQLTISDVTDPAKLSTISDYQGLGLTGNIVSATAHIPYTISVDRDGQFDIAPRPSKVLEALSYLSTSTKWKHTIIGWSGEVSTSSEQDSRSPDRARTYSGTEEGRFGSVTIRDVEGSRLKGAFADRMKQTEAKDREVTITREQRRGLETLLEHAFQDKILPVWLGDWSETTPTSLILRQQDRWHQYLSNAGMSNDSNGQSGHNGLDQAFADYAQMNDAVADAILKVYNPGDIVWIHDCSLMLLPTILRQKLPSAYICYYHHVDSSADDVIMNLKKNTNLMTGLLGASVIGIPTRELRQAFEEFYLDHMRLKPAGEGLIHFEDRQVALINVPIMLDMEARSREEGQDGRVRDAITKIRHRFEGQKIIVALGTQDQPEGLRMLLDGFETLLQEKATHLKEKIVLIIMTTLDPPYYSTLGPHYAGLDAETCQKMVTLNGKLSTAVWQPIIYIDGTSPPWDYVSLSRIADVGIVTTGDERAQSMGVEFSISQQGNFSPLMICGQPTTSDSANNAIQSSAAAAAIKLQDALNMSADIKQQHHKELYEYFAQRNFKTFTNEYLLRACNCFAKVPVVEIPELHPNTLLDAYKAKDKRLFMFDYDGTLTPIVNDPNTALPSKKLLECLPKLASNKQNQVWLISGRSREFLQQQFGHINDVGLSAEHGSFIRHPGASDWHNLAADMDMQWKTEASKVFEELVHDVPRSWIERKEVAIVWHYRNAADHDACLAKAVETKALLESDILKKWDVDVMLGKANVEVRPRFLNKGAVAAELIQEVFSTDEEGFVLCAGDDTTDEDMFRSVLSSRSLKAGTFSVLVSVKNRPSLASFRVAEPVDLVDAIAELSVAWIDSDFDMFSTR